jgi:transcriptional regulator with XRE-family HTH domain
LEKRVSFVTDFVSKSPSPKVMNQNEIIGNNIQQFRERLGINQEVLANYLGVSREVLSYFENGKRNIPTTIIANSAKLFGVEEYDLFEQEKENQTTNLAFAFRADSMTNEDLNGIANFKKIVLNYLSMKNALKNEPTNFREEGK